MDHLSSFLPRNEHAEKKLTLRTTDHPANLQKQLHKQWLEGQNCDLAISTGPCHLPVHSCVVSCFSAKICHHLLQASSLSTEQSQYSVAEDGVVYCLPQIGEKKVDISVEEDLLKALVGYMYTGSLSVKYSQTVALLKAAHLLDFQFVVDVMEIFITRNPDVLRYQMAPASGLDCATEEMLEMPAAESTEQASHTEGWMRHGSVSGNRQSHCPGQSDTTPAQLFGANKSCAEVPLDGSGLNVKSEVVDPDLQELLNFSAVVEGKEACPSVVNQSSPPDLETQPQTESKGHEESVDTSDTVKGRVVIKEEVLDYEDFPGMVSDKEEKHREADDSGGESDLASLSVCSEDAGSEMDAQEDHSPVQKKTNKTFGVSAESRKADAGTFICTCCTQSYGSRVQLGLHVYQAHKRHKIFKQICPHCDKQFKEKENLKSHCKEVHGDLVCEVKGCDYWTVHPALMNCHVTRYHNKRNLNHHQCSECDFRTTNKRSLRSHHRLHRAKYSCPVCLQTFFFKKNLKQHQHTVHKNKRGVKHLSKKCSQVGQKNDLNGNKDSTPVQSTTAVPPSQENNQTTSMGALEAAGIEAVLAAVQSELCQELGASSDVKKELVALEVSPTAEHFPDEMLRSVASAGSREKRKARKPEKLCKLCGRQHESRDMLFQHLRDEHGEECFACPQCPETFVRKEGLTNHVRIKHEFHSWTCSHCDDVFTVATRFSAHCRVEHNDRKPFHCKETSSCHFRTNQFGNLEFHKQHVHVKERTVVCDKCGKCFPSQNYLRLHQRCCLKLEQHLCSVCGEVFPLRASLKSHINNKHGGQRQYVCGQCGRRFSCHANRNRHMRIHNNTFPYICEICGEKFRHSNSLKDHVRRKHQEGL